MQAVGRSWRWIGLLAALMVVLPAWGAPDAPTPWSETAQRTWAAAYASLNSADVREFPWAADPGSSRQGESCEAVLYYASNLASAYIADTEMCLQAAATRGAASAVNLVYGNRETASARRERLYVAEPPPPPLAIPIVSEITGITRQGFRLPIVDNLNPSTTTYRVTLALAQSQDQPSPLPELGEGLSLGPRERVISSRVSESKCRTFGGLQPGSKYKFEVTAVGPEGAESAPVTWVFGRNPSAPITFVSLQERTGPENSWARARIEAVASIYGVTSSARQWMLSDLYVKGFRNEPGYAGYLGPDFVGVGYASPGSTAMHEIMHGFWGHWNFPQRCDEVNLALFRQDFVQFMLDFRRYERAGGANPLENWRLFYNRFEGPSRAYFEERGLWAAFEDGNFDEIWTPRFWDVVFHTAETQIPHMVAGKSSLVPPSLRPYFSGFLLNDLAGHAILRADGSRCYNPNINDNSFTWADEMYCYTSLSPEDGYLWNTAYDIAHLRNTAPAEYKAADSAPRSKLPQSLRSALRNTDRQRLVDFVNTLEEMSNTRSGGALWTKDPGFWGTYTRDHLLRSQFYLDELSSSIGVEISDANLATVKDVLRELNRSLSCARNLLPQGTNPSPDNLRAFIKTGSYLSDLKRDFVTNKAGLTALQRTAFSEMIDIYETEGHFVCYDWASSV